ncbi:hypothetical protein Ddye_014503 [Dipteronia dyeriana]|uniref:Retrotransposon gag domain-containing protein n=1 Tax=Dipteronia dyeriana TaxID=168575 RepID=A0AAD9X8E3_9ROSI|nr:hypothetical protein Ddye_014503 [Dipteronia dyeriana]
MAASLNDDEACRFGYSADQCNWDDDKNVSGWNDLCISSLRFLHSTMFLTQNDPRLPFWTRCNHMVLSWILKSVHTNISSSGIYAETVMDVWNDLHDRFSQVNDTRIYQICQEIVELRQCLESVSIYYTKLKALWDELSFYRTPHSYPTPKLNLVKADKTTCDPRVRHEPKVNKRVRIDCKRVRIINGSTLLPCLLYGIVSGLAIWVHG